MHVHDCSWCDWARWNISWIQHLIAFPTLCGIQRLSSCNCVNLLIGSAGTDPIDTHLTWGSGVPFATDSIWNEKDAPAPAIVETARVLSVAWAKDGVISVDVGCWLNVWGRPVTGRHHWAPNSCVVTVVATVVGKFGKFMSTRRWWLGSTRCHIPWFTTVECWWLSHISQSAGQMMWFSKIVLCNS